MSWYPMSSPRFSAIGLPLQWYHFLHNLKANGKEDFHHFFGCALVETEPPVHFTKGISNKIPVNVLMEEIIVSKGEFLIVLLIAGSGIIVYITVSICYLALHKEVIRDGSDIWWVAVNTVCIVRKYKFQSIAWSMCWYPSGWLLWYWGNHQDDCMIPEPVRRALIHWGQVTQICVNELNNNWFR